jgi:hypothetical protein
MSASQWPAMEHEDLSFEIVKMHRAGDELVARVANFEICKAAFAGLRRGLCLRPHLCPVVSVVSDGEGCAWPGAGVT